MQLDTIRGYQLNVAWRDYLNKQFEGTTGKAEIRNHLLMLDLSEIESVEVHNMRHISPRVAEMYAGKTTKTLLRDLVDLQLSMDLIEIDRQTVRANKKKILAFLPKRRISDTKPSATRRQRGRPKQSRD
jgi:hypothetical protein